MKRSAFNSTKIKIMKIFNSVIAIALSALALFGAASCDNKDYPEVKLRGPAAETMFTNPVVNGADPYVIQNGDTYYYFSTQGDRVKMWETKDLTQLASATSKDIFVPPAGAPNSKNVWAPEMFRLDNKWYVYYTAGDGEDINQRTWVLENDSENPMTGTWIDKGKITNENFGSWAIDGTVMHYKGSNYFLWSGRPDKTNKHLTQKIYISKMASPTTLEGPVTLLTQPEYDWERNGFGVNEAPEILQGPDNYFLIYSASFCGTDDYALGSLTLKDGGDPMVTEDWTKSEQPVFTKKPENNAYAPGHNGFFKSPDGTENWIIYHANSNSGDGCSNKRNVRMQPYTFNEDGTPNFGVPVATGKEIDKPSGEY